MTQESEEQKVNYPFEHFNVEKERKCKKIENIVIDSEILHAL